MQSTFPNRIGSLKEIISYYEKLDYEVTPLSNDAWSLRIGQVEIRVYPGVSLLYNVARYIPYKGPAHLKHILNSKRQAYVREYFKDLFAKHDIWAKYIRVFHYQASFIFYYDKDFNKAKELLHPTTHLGYSWYRSMDAFYDGSVTIFRGNQVRYEITLRHHSGNIRSNHG